MPPPSDERAHRERLRKEFIRRLQMLEIRKARQGDEADPAVDLQIEDLRANIAGLDMAEAPSVAPEVKSAIRSRFDDDLDFLIAQFRSITDRQNRTEEGLNRTEEGLSEAKQEIAGVKADIQGVKDAQSRDHVAGAWGRRRNFWLLLLAVGLSGAALGILIWWLI